MIIGRIIIKKCFSASPDPKAQYSAQTKLPHRYESNVAVIHGVCPSCSYSHGVNVHSAIGTNLTASQLLV